MTSRINTKNDNYVRTINETNEKSTKITFVNSKCKMIKNIYLTNIHDRYLSMFRITKKHDSYKISFKWAFIRNITFVSPTEIYERTVNEPNEKNQKYYICKLKNTGW